MERERRDRIGIGCDLGIPRPLPNERCKLGLCKRLSESR